MISPSRGGTVYTTISSTGLVALDAAHGTLLWQRQDYGSEYDNFQPAVANGLVYVVGSSIHSYPQETVTALDARNGHVHWTAPADELNTGFPGFLAVTVVGNTLYVTATRISALHASDGHLLWQYGSGALFAPPVVADGVVFVASGPVPYIVSPPNYLNALDARSGGLYWRTPGTNVALASSIST